MREILFRGKRKDNGEWVEGFLWKKKYNTNKLFISCFPDKDDNEEVFVIYHVTVGQYTGLTDKNGKKIFEGDIVRAEICEGNHQGFRFPVGEVVFENGSFCIKDYKQTTPLSSYSPRVQFEVIGNIHDNPELLKGAQE